jgi:hypothetical protein
METYAFEIVCIIESHISYNNTNVFTNIIRELIPVHQVYNKCTTAPSHGVSPTVCGAHPM